MPFYLNLKVIFSLIILLALIICTIFFFAFFAILSLPLIVLLFLFRKKILRRFFIKNFKVNHYKFKQKHDDGFYENNDNYIEVDYEINKEKNIK